MAAPYPDVMPQPFANNAPGPLKNTIPDTTATPGRASYDAGWPSETMQPIVSGGVAPLGPDFNGIMYETTLHTFFQQAGQLYQYSADVSTAIGGYEVGAVLGMADGSGAWINIVANNTTDPDAGGAGWVPNYSYGQASVAVTGGAATLTAAQARRNTIVFTGALVANSIVDFPNTLQRWLIVNNTTGAFTLTVKTAAGAGVAIPQGGFAAPAEVYGNGTDLNFAVSQTSLPTSVAPTNNSIPLRDGSGRLYATYFNQSSAIESFTASSVFAQFETDGFLRKMSMAGFRAQLLGGQTWQNVSASRTAGVSYTNSTGRPITAIISTSFSNNGTSSFTVAGVSLGSNVTIGAHQFMTTIIVPDGATYRCDVSGAYVGLTWVELR